MQALVHNVKKPKNPDLPFRRVVELVVYIMAVYVSADDAIDGYNLFGMDIRNTNLIKVK